MEVTSLLLPNPATGGRTSAAACALTLTMPLDNPSVAAPKTWDTTTTPAPTAAPPPAAPEPDHEPQPKGKRGWLGWVIVWAF